MELLKGISFFVGFFGFIYLLARLIRRQNQKRIDKVLENHPLFQIKFKTELPKEYQLGEELGKLKRKKANALLGFVVIAIAVLAIFMLFDQVRIKAVLIVICLLIALKMLVTLRHEVVFYENGIIIKKLWSKTYYFSNLDSVQQVYTVFDSSLERGYGGDGMTSYALIKNNKDLAYISPNLFEGYEMIERIYDDNPNVLEIIRRME